MKSNVNTGDVVRLRRALVRKGHARIAGIVVDCWKNHSRQLLEAEILWSTGNVEVVECISLEVISEVG